MQVVVECLFDKVVDERTNGRTFGANALRSQFGFCLGFKHGLLYLDGNRPNDGGPYVSGIIVLLVKLSHGLHDRFAESGLVRASLRGMLAVYERVIFLTVLLAMGNRYFDILPFEVDNGVAHG